jgi:hypothetical protein
MPRFEAHDAVEHAAAHRVDEIGARAAAGTHGVGRQPEQRIGKAGQRRVLEPRSSSRAVLSIGPIAGFRCRRDR